MRLQGLAEAEEELAAACVLVAARLPEAAQELDALQRLHVDAAARLRLASGGGGDPKSWLRGAWMRLRAVAWSTPTEALESLRDRELALARRYSEILHVAAPGAWQRYMRVERLVAMNEFGEMVPA